MDKPVLCSHCGQRPAVSRLEVSRGGDRTELDLCAECLRDVFSDVDKVLSTPRTGGPCPDCGWTWDEFKKTKHLGCPGCWDHFGQEIDRHREKRGQSGPYAGKRPRRLKDMDESQKRKDELRTALHEAIAAEEYERAAALRDRLKTLEETGRS